MGDMTMAAAAGDEAGRPWTVVGEERCRREAVEGEEEKGKATKRHDYQNALPAGQLLHRHKL